jgi:Ca2+-binding RTX toxin-like protein
MTRMKHALVTAALLSSAAAIAATVNGTSGADDLYGTTVGDTLNGYAGNDHLYGVGGNDFLNGGLGNDMLNGGPGWNQLSGGAGKDEFQTQQAANTVITDIESLESVMVSCESDWGAGNPAVNMQKLLLQNSPTPTADMVFTGRDGVKIKFSGFTKNELTTIMSNGGFPPIIEKKPGDNCT